MMSWSSDLMPLTVTSRSCWSHPGLSRLMRRVASGKTMHEISSTSAAMIT